MGWRFDWASFGSDFNFDYGVSFPKEEVAKGQVSYNYAMSPAFGSLEKSDSIVRVDKVLPSAQASAPPEPPDARSGVNPRSLLRPQSNMNVTSRFTW